MLLNPSMMFMVLQVPVSEEPCVCQRVFSLLHGRTSTGGEWASVHTAPPQLPLASTAGC